MTHAKLIIAPKKNPSSTINRKIFIPCTHTHIPKVILDFFFLFFLNPLQHIIFYIKKKLYAKFIDPPHIRRHTIYLSLSHTHTHIYIYMRVCVNLEKLFSPPGKPV
jgi:hypothetical protein